jgi:1-deoxy-D-xylulose 5-phosphate reductoisomerase
MVSDVFVCVHPSAVVHGSVHYEPGRVIIYYIHCGNGYISLAMVRSYY